MRSFNQIIIAGNVCRDPETRFAGNGTQVTSWSMATSKKKGDQETTTWFKAVAFSKTAELAAQYLQKGSEVYISGTLEQEEYTDREGQKRVSLVVNVDKMNFLSKGENELSRAQAATAAQAPMRKPAPKFEDDDYNEPF